MHRRSREASAKAREASENVAAIEREDQARRADALAQGADVDPGRDRETIATAEREAEVAAEAASVLERAYGQARSRLDAVCAERAEPWALEARKRLDRSAVELRAAVEVVEAAYAGWREARGQLALAENEHARRKSGIAADVAVPGLLAPGGNPILGSTVISALSHVADPEPVEVEPESEPLTVEDRRAIVASGGQVLGPGLG